MSKSRKQAVNLAELVSTGEFRFDQIGLVSDISMLLKKKVAEHLELPPSQIELNVEAYHFNAIIKGVNEMLPDLNRKRRPAKPGMGLDEWLQCDDVGLSAKAIVKHLTGFGDGGNDHPRDGADFKRCHQLLEAVPDLRPRIKEMAKVSTEWANWAEGWVALTNALVTEQFEELDRLITLITF